MLFFVRVRAGGNSRERSFRVYDFYKVTYNIYKL